MPSTEPFVPPSTAPDWIREAVAPLQELYESVKDEFDVLGTAQWDSPTYEKPMAGFLTREHQLMFQLGEDRLIPPNAPCFFNYMPQEKWVESFTSYLRSMRSEVHRISTRVGVDLTPYGGHVSNEINWIFDFADRKRIPFSTEITEERVLCIEPKDSYPSYLKLGGTGYTHTVRDSVETILKVWEATTHGKARQIYLKLPVTNDDLP